jgi:hypothetical protein
LTSSVNQERLKWRALALCSIASRHFFEGEPSLSVQACQQLAQLGPIIRESGLDAESLSIPWNRLIVGASQCESGRREGSGNKAAPQSAVPKSDLFSGKNLVYSVLYAMSTFPSDNNDEVYESLSNALVRRVVFLTGAIDMKGCPPPDRGEAAFIGRSNVGKSSLINMVRSNVISIYRSMCEISLVKLC